MRTCDRLCPWWPWYAITIWLFNYNRPRCGGTHFMLNTRRRLSSPMVDPNVNSLRSVWWPMVERLKTHSHTHTRLPSAHWWINKNKIKTTNLTMRTIDELTNRRHRQTGDQRQRATVSHHSVYLQQRNTYEMNVMHVDCLVLFKFFPNIFFHIIFRV